MKRTGISLRRSHLGARILKSTRGLHTWPWR
uniref:Uncharacterized protein n=1 Tax=Arundo donax TaxID=35708 RepID=A0A0A8YJZ1_ARUDO